MMKKIAYRIHKRKVINEEALARPPALKVLRVKPSSKTKKKSLLGKRSCSEPISSTSEEVVEQPKKLFKIDKIEKK
jgi:hypothetical protein